MDSQKGNRGYTGCINMPDMDMLSMPKMNAVIEWTECTKEHIIVYTECT